MKNLKAQTLIYTIIVSLYSIKTVYCGVVPVVPVEPDQSEFDGEDISEARYIRDLDLDAAPSNQESIAVTTDSPSSSSTSSALADVEQILQSPSQLQIQALTSLTNPQKIEILEGSESHQQVIDVIREGLTRLRQAGDRLRKFVDKIENGIQTGMLNQSIENVRTKIENGEIDFDKLVHVYNQKSPLNLPDLIQRISDDSHVLLDKLHGKIDAHIKRVIPESSIESSEDHSHGVKVKNSEQPQISTSTTIASILTKPTTNGTSVQATTVATPTVATVPSPAVQLSAKL